MFKHYERLIKRLSSFLNNLAAIALFGLMALVVGNVVLRLFGSPIQATYDFVEFLTAIAIGLSLAYCGIKDGHVSINLLTDKFPKKVQGIVAIIIGLISISFLSLVTWQIVKYANTMSERGEIAITTGVPVSPFIYTIALGFGVLVFVEIWKVFEVFINGSENK